MANRAKRRKTAGYILLLVSVLVLLLPSGAAAGSPHQGPWWQTTPEDENLPSTYDAIAYWEIAPRLHEIEVNSDRVQVDVIGQSAGGRDLFLVTVSAPEDRDRLGRYRAIRRTMLTDPEKAQALIDEFGDLKVPVFVNAGIHGNETTGVDAAIRLIETLAYEDGEEVQAILDNVVLLVNVVQNPDGRVQGTRGNADGFDLNRDFITQSQPEVRATVGVLTAWNPMVVLDLHGSVEPMLIEPCTLPHSPNPEYDLYGRGAYAQAEAMEAELLARTGFEAQIPFRDDALGWDYWPPTYTPVYGMFHGGYGHTLEAPFLDKRGVAAHYAAVWGALKFVAQNREGMIHDQIELFRRGFLGLPQMLIPDEILDQVQYDQYNALAIQEFPAAYVIPAGPPFQLSEHQAARLVDFLLFNDVRVSKAIRPFSLDGVLYPRGSYVVWMDQPKRGLANTILAGGRDLSSWEGLSFYSPPSVWSNPLLWGTDRAVAAGDLRALTVPIGHADPPTGSVEWGWAGAYAYQPASLAAFQATNALLARGETLYRATAPFEDRGRTFAAGTILLPADPAPAEPTTANEPDCVPVDDRVYELVDGYALDLSSLEALPEAVVPMAAQRVAVYGDEGVVHAIRTLGFRCDPLSRSDLDAGAIADYDVLVAQDLRWSRLDEAGQASFLAWSAAGGDYVGLPYRRRAIDLALETGLIDVDYRSTDTNAIVRLDYTPGDPLAAGFWAQDYAFVYYPLWFTRLGEGVEVTASLAGEDFVVSGFWPGWQESGAAGLPVVVHASEGLRDVTLVGIDPTFRGHPENTFRLLGNAIYSGLD